MRSEPQLPGFGDVPKEGDQLLLRLLQQIKELIEIREGRRGSDNLDTAVTYRDLVNLGLITESDVPTK